MLTRHGRGRLDQVAKVDVLFMFFFPSTHRINAICGVFTFMETIIDPKNQPHVGKYTIQSVHGSFAGIPAKRHPKRKPDKNWEFLLNVV